MGRLTRDVELRYTPKGTAVADIAMAINRFRAGADGERSEETTYVDVTLWGRQAEIANQYLSKGREVFIEGRLQLDSWEDKTSGQKRSRLKVVGEQMQFVGGGGGGQSGGSSPQGGNSSYGGGSSPMGDSSPPPASEAAPSPAPTDSFDDEDDEIPF